MPIYTVLLFGLWAIRPISPPPRGGETKEPRRSSDLRGSQKTAATYSPNWWVSTIGVGELNFSVRNGKRWFLTAITAAYIT